MPNKQEILEFSTFVEELANTLDLSIIDTLIEHCTTTGLEIESCASLLSLPLKQRIQEEAEKLHLLKASGDKLPL